MGALARDGAHLGVGVGVAEVADELLDLAGEVHRGGLVAAQRAGRERVGAGGAPEAEVDAAGVDRREGAELLGDDVGRVVRQHDAAGTDSDRLGLVGDVPDEHRRRARRDAAHVVVLGHPVALVAPLLRVAGDVDRRGDGLTGGAAVEDGHEVEDVQLGSGGRTHESANGPRGSRYSAPARLPTDDRCSTAGPDTPHDTPVRGGAVDQRSSVCGRLTAA